MSYTSPVGPSGQSKAGAHSLTLRAIRAMMQQDVRDAIMQIPEPSRSSLLQYIEEIAALVTKANQTMDQQAETIQARDREINRMQADKQRRDNILQLCKEALSQVRLDTKYMIFDLQCTRDERDDAIRRLGE